MTPTDGRPARTCRGRPDRELRRASRREALGDGLDRLEREHPEAFTAFEAFAAAERVRAGRFAEQLTGRGRVDFLAEFDSGAYRLELFERWLGGEGRRFRGHIGVPRAREKSAPSGRPASRPAPGDPVSTASDRLECGEGEGTDDPGERMVGVTGTRGDGRSTTR